MDILQYLKVWLGVAIGVLLIWISITGELGSLLGAILVPDYMVQGSPGSGAGLPGGNPGAPASGQLLTAPQIAQIAEKAGFTSSHDVTTTAVAIAIAESGGSVSIINPNDLTDYGLWQINIKAHPQYDPQKLITYPLYNAQAAYAISSQGTNWNPWTTYTNGQYKQYWNVASNAVYSLHEVYN